MGVPSDQPSGMAIWADSSHLTVSTSGSRIILESVSSGEQQVFADTGRELVGYPVWTRDGSTVAVQFQAGTLVVRGGRSVIDCQGAWAPLGWSPDGRFLVLRSGNNADEFKLHLLDTRKSPDTCATVLIPEATSVQAWHPNSTAVLLKGTMSAGNVAGDLQLWEFTREAPHLVKDLGYGYSARWVSD